MSREVKRFGPLNWERCMELLGGKKTRRIGPNTYLESVPLNHTICVRFHNTDIIRFRADGKVLLYSGGYRSTTTKQRLCALSPVHVHQHKHVWYVGEREFTEGMDVGSPVDASTMIRRMAAAGDELAIAQLHDMTQEVG